MVSQELIEALASARRPVIVGHVNPDADALGSMIALARAMPPTDVAIALPAGSVGQRLQFMLQIGNGIEIADAARVADADTVVIVDTASAKRVNIDGKWDAIADKFVVNIDHHITNTDFGRINWVDDAVASTCEMVYRLIHAANWPLDAPTASLLYAGIYADTCGFSLPNATADAFEVAAGLARAGADIELVGSRLSRSQGLHDFDLVRTVYHNTKVAANGHIAYSTLSYQEITSAGCTSQDIDDQVSIPRSLLGIKIAALFSEGEPGVIRINLRGEDGTPVLPIAQKLGGGGHRCSAGVRVRDSMEAVVERVLAEATAMLTEQSCSTGE